MNWLKQKPILLIATVSCTVAVLVVSVLIAVELLVTVAILQQSPQVPMMPTSPGTSETCIQESTHG